MKVVEYGKGHRHTIVLIHGGGLSWWNYKKAAEILSDRFHIVLPILDGHSGSDAPFTSIENNAAKIIDYIDACLGGHVLAMGGLSLGGQVLTEILSQRGGICAYAMVESALAKPMRWTAALIRPTYALCYPLIKKRWFARLQFQALQMNAEYFEDYYADTASISKADMIAFLTANAAYCLKDTLARCKANVLVVVGSKERAVMKTSAAWIAGALPAARMEILQNYHHGDLSLNHPEDYAEKLLQLIRL